MDLSAVAGQMELEHKLFAATALVSAVLTVLISTANAEPVQLVLFGSFTLYLAGGAYPHIDDYVPEFKRTGAIALGGVGMLALLAGTASPLPVVFVMGGALALLGLF